MKKKINIFGLGYVGYPLMLILANKKLKGKSLYDVTGIEVSEQKKIEIELSINNKILPFDTTDNKLIRYSKNNLSKTIKILSKDKIDKIGGIILICINFDGPKKISELKFFFNNLSRKVQENSTIIIESTLIPGTCEKILYPIIKKQFKKRNLNINKLSFGYSYERIMPGDNYVNSITENYKNISGINNFSKRNILKFYKTFLNYKKFPISEFSKITECETAKIMENSYRALNIAFIDEWNKFSHINKLNLKKIINSIKVRNSHSNIMRPGIGVGGYCLTKDPMFGQIAGEMIFKKKTLFPLCKASIKINKQMPNFCFNYINQKVKDLKNKKILIIGSAYKSDVSDIRHSPSINLARQFYIKKFNTTNIDPMVNKKVFLKTYPKKLKLYDIIIFSVPHKYFKKIKYSSFNSKTIIFDIDYVLNDLQIKNFTNRKIKIFQMGDYSE